MNTSVKLKIPSQGFVVRLYPQSREILDDLALELDESMAEVVHQSLEAYKKQVFFDKLEKDYSLLQKNHEEWEEYKKELEVWDQTLLDGLDETEPKKIREKK